MLIDFLLENKVVCIFLAATIGLFYFTILTPFYLSPLKNVPGPKIAAVTKWWILYITWAEKRNRTVHELHKKYGPIVRLSPSEVSISDPDYLKDIYISGNYDKSGFYAQFSNYGEHCTFSILTKKDHIKKRKASAPLYNKSFVTSEPIEELVQTKVKETLKFVGGTNVEVYELFHCLAMDVVTGLIFGQRNGTQLLQDFSQKSWKIVDDYRKQTSTWFWTTLMPEYYDIAAGKERLEAGARAQNWNLVNCQNAVENGALEDDNSVMKKLYASNVTGLSAFSEVQDHVAAGHETTGATLSFLTHHLSQHPDIQEKLHEELVGTFGKPPVDDPFYVPPYKDVDALRYLNGVVMETLRLYAAIPGAEPRIVPAIGMNFQNKYFLPGGTIVSIQPWTLHRDENVYKNAEEFNPLRWIDSSEEELKVMNKSFMAFGKGIKMCLGQFLATEEIKLLVTAIYWRYRTSVNASYDPFGDNMYVVDKYVVHPKSHSLKLDFEKIAY